MNQGGLAQYNNVYIVQSCFLVDVGEGREYKGELLYCTLRFISLPGVVTSICHWYLTHTRTHAHTRTHSGIWNVPFISSAILFSGTWLQAHRYDLPTFTSEQWDPDMAFAAWMREKVSCCACCCVSEGSRSTLCSFNSVRLTTF